jgi:hypothetical protein
MSQVTAQALLSASVRDIPCPAPGIRLIWSSFRDNTGIALVDGCDVRLTYYLEAPNGVDFTRINVGARMSLQGVPVQVAPGDRPW